MHRLNIYDTRDNDVFYLLVLGHIYFNNCCSGCHRLSNHGFIFALGELWCLITHVIYENMYCHVRRQLRRSQGVFGHHSQNVGRIFSTSLREKKRTEAKRSLNSCRGHIIRRLNMMVGLHWVSYNVLSSTLPFNV